MAKKKKKATKKKGTRKKAAKKKAKRTVLYSSTGKKLYAKRDAGGKFKDIQSYARAHAADLRKKSADE
jgi:DNA-binding protein HU-beta